MKNTSRVTVVWSIIAAVLYGAQPGLTADRLNTAYISTTPGSSTVVQVAKDARIFEKHGIDATVIFISGSVRGIQSILAGRFRLAKEAALGWRARGWRAVMWWPSPATSMCYPIIW